MNEIITRVSKVFKKTFETDEFNPDLSGDMNNMVGWDSLKHISLIMELEKEFNVRFDYTEIPDLTTVKNIVDIINKHQLTDKTK